MIGLAADAWRATDAQGILRVPGPLIAHLSSGYFVVVMGRTSVPGTPNGPLAVFDPNLRRRRRVTPEALYRDGGGWILTAG